MTQFLRSQVPKAPIAQGEGAKDFLVAAVLSDGCPKEFPTQYKALNISVFNPESLDITEVEKVIEDVCHTHNIPLINPPIHPK